VTSLPKTGKSVTFFYSVEALIREEGPLSSEVAFAEEKIWMALVMLELFFKKPMVKMCK
jgi:hypothetical protein